MALVQRKEIKSSNVLGETLQDTTDTFTGSVRKFIYIISILEMWLQSAMRLHHVVVICLYTKISV